MRQAWDCVFCVLLAEETEILKLEAAHVAAGRKSVLKSRLFLRYRESISTRRKPRLSRAGHPTTTCPTPTTNNAVLRQLPAPAAHPHRNRRFAEVSVLRHSIPRHAIAHVHVLTLANQPGRRLLLQRHQREDTWSFAKPVSCGVTRAFDLPTNSRGASNIRHAAAQTRLFRQPGFHRVVGDQDSTPFDAKSFETQHKQ